MARQNKNNKKKNLSATVASSARERWIEWQRAELDITQIVREGASEEEMARTVFEPGEMIVAEAKHAAGLGAAIGKRTLTEKKGKQRANVTEQTDEPTVPMERSEEPQAESLPEQRSILTGCPPTSNAGPSIEPIAYRVPPVRRPPPNIRVRCKWPEQACKPHSIAEVQKMINRIYTYSSQMKGVQSWGALEPDKWLPMLQSICTGAEEYAENETATMEADLKFYRSLFPAEQAAALRWPMRKKGHHHRHQLRNILVK
ncbi:hypothetical protein HBI70_173230 [Parastagonospora nodorum]|nr:hypothetical protein HBI80_243280 [Parastagonospora nodorum]KAH5258436.1 hypothetical protein HBI70_173230 [Parastagonospora nodorum]KAH5437199.1 hypothetical protein HBI32_023450 [Parastagonospora nodorum]KAH5470015.1 hypothetical protein HBI28_164180 [Parastagonospora nodorum]KAH5641269.1 hypothetical protein HBI22_060200 [Parastagonospora nodorum]